MKSALSRFLTVGLVGLLAACTELPPSGPRIGGDVASVSRGDISAAISAGEAYRAAKRLPAEPVYLISVTNHDEMVIYYGRHPGNVPPIECCNLGRVKGHWRVTSAGTIPDAGAVTTS